MIAQVPTVPWPVTTQWLFGLLGAAAVVYLGLSIATQARKLWGRRPPIDDDFARLRLEMKTGDEALGRRMDQLDEQYISLQTERERTWRELKDEISAVREDLSFIRGRMEKGHRP